MSSTTTTVNLHEYIAEMSGMLHDVGTDTVEALRDAYQPIADEIFKGMEGLSAGQQAALFTGLAWYQHVALINLFNLFPIGGIAHYLKGLNIDARIAEYKAGGYHAHGLLMREYLGLTFNELLIYGIKHL